MFSLKPNAAFCSRKEDVEWQGKPFHRASRIDRNLLDCLSERRIVVLLTKAFPSRIFQCILNSFGIYHVDPILSLADYSVAHLLRLSQVLAEGYQVGSDALSWGQNEFRCKTLHSV